MFLFLKRGPPLLVDGPLCAGLLWEEALISPLISHAAEVSHCSAIFLPTLGCRVVRNGSGHAVTL